VDEAVLNKIASNVDAVTEKVIKTFYKEEIGIVLLLKTQVKLYVQKFLDVEKKRVPYSISSTENELDTFIKINELNIKLYGRPDRIIHQHGTYFIQDFKTGKEYKTKTDNLEDVFASDIQMKYLFQLLFYGYLFNKKKPDTLLNGELIYIKKYSEPLKNMLQMEKKTINISAITEPFETILVQKCKEIFSTDIPFSQTLDIKNCEYCDFNIICRKF
jgi:predicted RecB family nuclease